MSLDALANELQSLTALSPQHVLALGVFASYFGLIGWLLSNVLESIRGVSNMKPQMTPRERSPKGEVGKKIDEMRTAGRVWVFWALTVASFAHTWYYMFRYMAGSFHSYQKNHPTIASEAFIARLSSWLRDTSLFEEAWYAVCAGKWNWLWSEQLCLFTVGVWTVMLWAEGRRHGIRHVWAYMLLGQVVAISVASNLFYVAVLSAARSPQPKGSTQPSLVTSTSSLSSGKPDSKQANDDEEGVKIPPTVYIPVLLSLLAVAVSPHTSPGTFLPNLLLMHTFIVIPLLPITQSSSHCPAWGISLRTIYYTIFLLSIPIRYRTLVELAPDAQGGVIGWFERQWVVLHESPAQSSIGWDVVWTTVSFVVWVLLTGGSPAVEKRKGGQEEGAVWSRLWKIVYLVFVTPIAGVGITGAYVLKPGRRDDEEEEEEVKQE